MLDKVFVDSNICLYIHDKLSAKFDKTKQILANRPTISTQVLLENVNVCLKKLKQPKNFAIENARSLQQACHVNPISPTTFAKALLIFERYGFSIFDCLIVASALETDCNFLYTEDLQHNQLIEGKLKIINPFL
jgi:predicted nucleic acid-binding protein